MQKRPRMALLTVVVGAGLLAGCGSSSLAEPAATPWSEPAWMAQYRQDLEEFQAAHIACLADLGVVGTPDPSGAVVAEPVGYPAPGWGVVDRSLDAVAECWDRIDPLRWWGPPFEDMYARVLDTRQCLIAHGFEVPEAPDFETWNADDGDNRGWNAHAAAFNVLVDSGVRVTNAMWIHMNDVCPQAGPGTVNATELPDE